MWLDYLAKPTARFSRITVTRMTCPGWCFWFTWAFCSEAVPLGGPVIAKVDPEYMDGYIAASRDVWYHDYLYHKLAVLTVEKVEG